ncbi:MAG: uridine kinase [Bryobacteraceae bacterium]
MLRPYLIGVAGPSGSGKTELARKLASALSAPVVALDSYYRELSHLTVEERARVNFDVPAALDHDLLCGQLALLAAGGEIAVPVYDFSRHTRAPEVQCVRAGRFAIVEGLFALYWEQVRALLGTGVYVHTADELCFARRLERDVRERGRTPESVVAQYEQTVRPMAERYVFPERDVADVVVSGVEPLERTAAQVLEHVYAQIARREPAGGAAAR